MTDFHYDVEKTDHYYIDDITIFGKSVQDGTPTPLSPVLIQVVETINFLNTSLAHLQAINTAGTWTGNKYTYRGVDVTVNDDGTLTISGTATGTYTFYIESDNLRLTAGSYYLAACPSGGSQSTYYTRVTTLNSSGTVVTRNNDNGSGVAFTITSAEVKQTCHIHLTSGDSFTTPVTINPRLNAGSTAAPFMPYGYIVLNCGNTVTPIDLQGNFLASLPNDTRDVLEIDSAGNVAIIKNIGYIASYDGESVGSVYLSTTGELTSGASVYYKLTTAQTIELNPIVLPSNSEEPYTVSVTASITPETAINQTNKPTYEVENQYEHIPGAKMEIPPVHPLMQEWETFDPNNWDEQSMMDYTYQNEWHAVYTVYLGELMQSGVFDWSRPELDWSDAAIDEEQYKRVCDYFNLRFKWREISMLPVLKWFDYLHNKLVYELMPKYKPLYERVAEGVNPLSDNSEYYKSRSIESAYPETLLSQNADYITDGRDIEEQRIKEKGTADAMVNFAEVYKGVDQLLLDELEVMFVSLYITNINGL